MSAVHDRWELVEPLLFAHALRDAPAFEAGETQYSQREALEGLKREHRFTAAAIAQAFNVLEDRPPSMLGGEKSGAEREKTPLFEELQRVAAQCWLVADGDHWALRVERRRPGHEIIRWRGVTMLVPPSIVVGAALSMTERSHPRCVQVLPDSIAPQEPVGHLHVHLGPILPFEALWAQLWYAFLLRGNLNAASGEGIAAIKGEALPEIGKYESKRQPGLRWQWLLELAFVARVWLSQENHGSPPAVLQAFAGGRADHERRAGTLLRLWSGGEWRNSARKEARRLTRQRLEEDRTTFQQRITARNGSEGGSDAAVSAPHDGDDDVAFLAQAFRRCRNNNAEYARVFYQYLRVKVALYRCLVVDPWTSGLDHFLAVVKRDTNYTNVIDDKDYLDGVRLSAARSEKPLRVGALEIHIPPSRWLKQRRLTQGDHHKWLLSFVRAKPPAKNDPTGSHPAGQWRRVMAAAGTTCRLLARRVTSRPSLLREFRALSVMDSERNGPIWLFEAAFQRIREASEDVAATHSSLNLRPVHTALHLGEDFEHLLTGLRQIIEPFEWGLIRRGDRLGHALALGRSAEAWCEENPWIQMRPWDRILDIGFVYWAVARLGLELGPQHLERMRIHARDAICRVFDDACQDPLEEARLLWLSLPRLPPDGGHRSEAGQLDGARLRKARVLDERSVGRRALASSLAVETRHDLPPLLAVQAAVHDRVAKAHVAIEVNPSSNLLIGGFRSMFEQPVFHTDDLPITLNADDPMTFATTLADEYAYAWAGMVIGSGQSPHQATRRLEEAARCSMRYAFLTDEERYKSRE